MKLLKDRSSLAAIAALAGRGMNSIGFENGFNSKTKLTKVIDQRSLSATKKYATMKKTHNVIGSKVRGAVQLREAAVGVHWRQA